jgi:subtilase family serine protease
MARVIIAVLAVVLALALVDAKMFVQRTTVPPNFVRLGRTDPNMMFDFRVALKQRNVDVLEATLLDVSNPESANYGKWWTTEQILDLIAPSKDEIRPVVAWLKSFGIQQIDVSGRDFIKVVAPIRIIENLFQTQFYNYQYTPTGKIHSRIFGAAHIPEHLEIIDMIFGLTELVKPSSINAHYKPVDKRSVQQDPLGYIYPGILRTMYGVPSKYWVNAQSSICVAEFQDDASFNKQDLTTFNQGMNEKIHVDKIVGPYSGDSPDAESTLDVQYASALALNSTFWFWTVDRWMYEFATQLFNAKSFPYVVSMSWGWPEDEQCQIVDCSNGQSSYQYVNKVNTEFVKIGLKGVTLLAASGDQGAPGDEFTDCSGGISTIFPGASPWVTSVGATMLVSSSSQAKRQANQPPVCQQMTCATTTTEGVCTYPTALITTGGGFSDVSPTPAWQRDVVKAYLNSGVQLPTGNFNASNRGFPDVAANGHNYLIQMLGQGFVQVDGTSASSPVFAAVVSLLNSFLLDHGKAQIGFANPLLYKMYDTDKGTFTDITSGNNYCTESCCGSVGYVATKGWDAVSGLGTPVFPKMQNYLKTIVLRK